MAEDVARLLSAARSKGRLTTVERKRAQALMISVAVSALALLHCSGHASQCGPVSSVSCRTSYWLFSSFLVLHKLLSSSNGW